jgi:exopolysaccharide biosynthesis polyprenyl glycosylphosphotransferase
MVTSISLKLRVSIDPNFAQSSHYPLQVAVMLACWLFAMSLEGGYNTRYLGTGIQEYKLVARGAFKGFLYMSLIALLIRETPSRLSLVVAWLGSVMAVTLGRKFLQMWLFEQRKHKKMLRNTLIIGSLKYASLTKARLSTNSNHGLNFVGHIPLLSESSVESSTSWLNSIDQSLRDANVEVIIIEDAGIPSADLLSKLSWHLNQREVDVLIAPGFIHQFGPRLELESHPQLGLLYLDEPALTLSDRAIKRTMDLTLGVLALLIFLPLIALIAVGVTISSPGPILFTQNRVGRSGTIFKFVKFRTMVVGAENMRQEVLGTPDDAMVNRYKNDPRIYPFGRLLRRLSLDELPQLVAVITGKMSLVGPRPLLIEELHLLGDDDHRRHITKPGLTGLWQINGRKETTWDERIQFDLLYVHNWSVGLDIAILVNTVKTILTGHGSY